MQEDNDELEEIIDRKPVNGVYRYKVKWKGDTKGKFTWEMSENLQKYTKEIEAFNTKLKEKKGGKRKSEVSGIKQDDNNKDNDNSSEKHLLSNKRSLRSNNQQQPKKRQKLQLANKKENSSFNDINEEVDTKDIEGNFECDIPLKVVSAKRHESIPCDLLLEVEWEKRKDGIKPKNSKVKNSEMKKYAPEILCEYYEKHLIFPQKRYNNK